MLYQASMMSQYAESPIINAILASTELAMLPPWDDFYDKIWNIDTAEGYGLDVWGRILGVSRVLQIPTPGDYFGFSNGAGYEPFDQGVFYHGGSATDNFALTDDVYRRLLLAKAALNITNSSAKSINAIIMALFPDYGNSYVADNLDMTITYTFGSALSPVDHAIVTQSGVLPKPTGVSFTVSP